MKYKEALHYLSTFVNFEYLGAPRRQPEWSLDRMRILLARLGRPERGLRIVQIAGTNGKGSTAAFLSSVASGHGYRTGLYTSPHLSDVRERIRLDGEWIGRADFGKGMALIKDAVDGTPWPPRLGRPTYFELLTAMALWYFKLRNVDLAVLEAGLGGRWDATNAVWPLVCAFTPIGLDHQTWLGQTLQQIAHEKAAIIKSAVPVCIGPQRAEVMRIIKNRCLLKGARLIRAPRVKTRIVGLNGVRFLTSFSDASTLSIRSRLTGSFQINNANLAFTIYRTLHERYGFKMKKRNVQQGILSAVWPGRFETVKRRPVIILDGAHNSDAVDALARSLRNVYPGRRFRVIFGASKDKAIARMIGALRGLRSALHLVSSHHPRAARPHALVPFAHRAFREIHRHASVEDALREAVRLRMRDEIIVATGSLFVAGEARKILCPN